MNRENTPMSGIVNSIPIAIFLWIVIYLIVRMFV